MSNTSSYGSHSKLNSAIERMKDVLGKE
jgi:hypothetical protein